MTYHHIYVVTVSPLSSLVCRYYDAVIDMLSEDGETCTVTFDGYGTTVIVKVMYPIQWSHPDGMSRGEGGRDITHWFEVGKVSN